MWHVGRHFHPVTGNTLCVLLRRIIVKSEKNYLLTFNKRFILPLTCMSVKH